MAKARIATVRVPHKAGNVPGRGERRCEPRDGVSVVAALIRLAAGWRCVIDRQRHGVSRVVCRRRPSSGSSPHGCNRPTGRSGWRGWSRLRRRRSARCCAGTATRGAKTRRSCGPLRTPLRTRAARRALPRRHEAPRPLLGARRARPRCRRWQAAPQPSRRLAAAPRRDRRPLAARLRRDVASQDAESCSRFHERATAWYREQGVIVERVMTDNAKAYTHAPDRDNTPGSRSSVATPASTGPAATAKRNASSKRCCVNGHTHAATPRANNAPADLPATSAGTTDTDRTARTTPDRQSAASHTSVVTTAS